MEETRGHLLDYLRTIYRHRRLALTALCVVFLYNAIQTYSATPIYRGQVQLLVESTSPNVVGFQQVIDQPDYNYDFYPTQYAILRSRALARRTIDTLKLWDSPEFGGGKAGRSSNAAGEDRGAIGWIQGLFSKPAKPVSAPNANETSHQSSVIDAFLGRLTVAPIRNSRLVDVRYSSASPQMAAAVPNALARQYIEQNLEYRFLSSKEASDWLSQQLAVERKKLEESEQTLQRYRETGDAVALEDRQNIVVQRLADLNAAYTQARTDRLGKEALYNQLQNLQHDRPALDSFPAILANSFIQQLKSQLADLQRQQAQMADRLGEKHPDMVKLSSAIENTEAKLQAELAKVVQSVQNEYLAAQAKERSLQGELDSQKAGALALNRKGIEYSVLRRDVDSNKQVYEALLQRTKETSISGELKASNIRIVDQAELPRGPVSPNRPRDLMMGLVGGLMLGIGLAFLVDYLDNRIKNPDEIRQFLGVGFLGLVPAVRQDEGESAHLLVSTGGVPQNFCEAFRAVRTGVQFSSAGEGSRSVLVTSTQPGEGKTIVAANLALSLAQSGSKVLLVDADMRKPKQHELHDVPQAPGLSNLMVGEAKANDVIQKTSSKSLWLMPAGQNPPNPAELLGSARFRELLRLLGNHFEWIVIDSPPLMAVTDASVIAHLTTGVVFVVGSEQVNRRVARNAVELLQASKATVLGAVLNRVNVRRHPYYYSHYYKHEYAGYYASEKPAVRVEAGAGKPEA